MVDNEGDEFYDASADPSSPTFLSRAASKSSGRLPFSDQDSQSVASREGSFKDAPGPSELWRSQSQDQGQCHRTLKCAMISLDFQELKPQMLKLMINL